MQQRLFFLASTLIPLGLASCYTPPLPPNGGVIFTEPPRYGQPPPPGGTQYIQPQQQPQQQGQAQAPQSPYEWQRRKSQQEGGMDPQSGTAPSQAPGQTPGTTGTPPPSSPPYSGTTPGSSGNAPGGGTQPPASSTPSEPIKYGIPVPGKDGMLYSPHNPDAGFIDITTRGADGSTTVLPPGTKIKDPFSGKPILVP